MGALSAYALTLADWAKRLDPDGKTSSIVELLGQSNEVLDDMLWMEGNLPTGHRTTVRTGLPTPAWRLLNQGVQPSKSTSAQIDEGIGMLEAWSEVDKDLAELNGNESSFRLSEASAFVEGMNQEMASVLFYGNSGLTPEKFTGLAPRYSSLSAANGANVIDGGGSGGDNSSIWLVSWGSQSFSGIFPKGSKAGLIHEDMGLVTVETTAAVAGTRMRAYQDRWQWKCGVALRDWRYVVRIANIDISNLVASSSAADLTQKMIFAMHRLPTLKMGKPVFYMNRSCFEMLDVQRRNDVMSGGGITFQNVDGDIQYNFRGIPIRKVDALTQAETQVT